MMLSIMDQIGEMMAGQTMDCLLYTSEISAEKRCSDASGKRSAAEVIPDMGKRI